MLHVVLLATLAVLGAQSQAQEAGAYVTYDTLQGRPYNVTYDERSFIINGQVCLRSRFIRCDCLIENRRLCDCAPSHLSFGFSCVLIVNIWMQLEAWGFSQTRGLFLQERIMIVDCLLSD